MSFSILSLTTSPHAKLPRGVTAEKFEAATLHLKELFLANLPDGFVLDGNGTLELRFGDRGEDDETRYLRGRTGSVCYVEGFDFSQWKTAGPAAQDAQVLEAMVSTVDRIAHAFRSDRNAVKAAAKKLQDSQFRGRVPEPDLSQTLEDGNEVRVVRDLSRDGVLWDVEVTNGRSKVLHSESLGKASDDETMRKKYRKSRLKGSEYQLLNAEGRPSFRLSLEKALAEA